MYDVFISFKNLDANGQPTRDRMLASEVFAKLRARGVNVFFSESSLSTTRFMDQIFEALGQAKVLVLVGTSLSNINSEWVKSEWSNYLGSIYNRTNPNGQLLTLLEGISASDLPIQLSNFQSYNSKDIDKLVEFILLLLSGKAPKGAGVVSRPAPKKRTFSRVLFVLFAAALAVAACVVLPNLIPHDGTMPEGVLYSVNDGTITIDNYTGHDAVLDIPASVDGCKVTKIGSEAFSGCDFLTDVRLPDTVLEIGDSAFSGCTGLEKISLPADLQSIRGYAFTTCTSLKHITIPGGVRKIGSGAFWSCTGLESAEMLNGVEEIGELAFWGCKALQTVTIPSSVKTIGANAFYATSARIKAPYSPQFYNYEPTEYEEW